MKGDVFFPTTFSPTPPLPIAKSQHESPPSSPSSTPPSTPPYSSSSPSSLSSAFSSPTPAFSSTNSHYLSSSVPSNPSPFLSHSPPSSPSPTLPTTTVMATTLFLPPLTNTSTPFRSHVRRDQEEEEDDVEEEEEEVDIDDDVDVHDHDENLLSHSSLLSPYMHSNSISYHQHRHSLPLHHYSHMRRAASDEAIYQRTSLSLGASLGVGSGGDRQDEDHHRHVVVVHQHHDEADVGVEEEDDDVDDVEVEDVEIIEGDDEEEEEEECQETELHHLHQLGGVGVAVAVGAAAVGLEVATSMRRVTLKPRRTLSLSPTPARPGDMSMGRNLRAACWFDYTNKDDDDGLCRPVDSDTETTAKRKTENDENGNLPDCPDKATGGSTTNAVAGDGSQPTVVDVNGNTDGGSGGVGTGATPRFARRGLPLGASSSLPALSTIKRASVKRPLEVTLPCQEIQYLDISYQKVGTNMVQFSPIPRKKIAYHPVLHHTIHYCEVSYCPNTNTNTERPIKRKPLGRSHSFAVSDLRERIGPEGNYKFR